jgi:hypothetical protein
MPALTLVATMLPGAAALEYIQPPVEPESEQLSEMQMENGTTLKKIIAHNKNADESKRPSLHGSGTCVRLLRGGKYR